jgi:hypothetical protein
MRSVASAEAGSDDFWEQPAEATPNEAKDARRSRVEIDPHGHGSLRLSGR